MTNTPSPTEQMQFCHEESLRKARQQLHQRIDFAAVHCASKYAIIEASAGMVRGREFRESVLHNSIIEIGLIIRHGWKVIPVIFGDRP